MTSQNYSYLGWLYRVIFFLNQTKFVFLIAQKLNEQKSRSRFMGFYFIPVWWWENLITTFFVICSRAIWSVSLKCIQCEHFNKCNRTEKTTIIILLLVWRSQQLKDYFLKLIQIPIRFSHNSYQIKSNEFLLLLSYDTWLQLI